MVHCVYVNTTSAFNVNYKIAVTCIKLHWLLYKMFILTNHINEYSFWSMCSKCPLSSVHHHAPACTWSQMVTPLVNHSIHNVLVRVKPSLHQAFSHVVDVIMFVSCTHCCITSQVSEFKAHDNVVHFDEAVMHLMQFSFVICHCNITFMMFWLSQGSVATFIRWGEWSSLVHAINVLFILISNSENCTKIRWCLSKLQTKISLLLFMVHDVVLILVEILQYR